MKAGVSTHSAIIKLSPHPTPTCVHFKTVATTPQQLSLPKVPSSGILDSEKIKATRSASCSRRNFSARLVAELFDENTRKRSNISGKLGKLRLNPALMNYAKSMVFQFYPLEHSESEKAEWEKCFIAIDEFNRRLNKQRKSAVEQHAD